MNRKISRRTILASSATFVPGVATANYVSRTDGFAYEVSRSPVEWMDLLGEASFKIMREGDTEPPKSDPRWDSLAAGTYSCKGCDLELYDARWKEVLEQGWLFFRHSQPNSLLMGIDWPEGSGMADEYASLAAVEVHCRRCGSHMGHIVMIDKTLLHCINGASMNFSAAA